MGRFKLNIISIILGFIGILGPLGVYYMLSGDVVNIKLALAAVGCFLLTLFSVISLVLIEKVQHYKALSIKAMTENNDFIQELLEVSQSQLAQINILAQERVVLLRALENNANETN